MRKVLVTGGNGFIGKHTVEELRRREYEVMILDHHSPGYVLTPPDGLTPDLFLGDIRDAEAVTEVVAHVDGVIHLAGVLGTQETIFNPRPAAATNILGGLNLLEAVTQYDVPMVNIAVGNYWMNNTYSISKSTVERFCEMFRIERGAKVSVLRALNAYGPGQSVAEPFGVSKVRKIMPAFICRALTGQKIEVYGNGEQVMDMVYVGDVARDLVDLLEATEQHGPATSVLESGTGRDTTVNDIANAVIAEVGNGELKHLPMRPGEPEHSVVKAKRPYGRHYKSLEDGVAETVDWFKRMRGVHWQS
jgi:UDP-glucose 4-epimerase